MQKKINEEFIYNDQILIKGIKKEVPIVSIKPRVENLNNSIGLIFFNGLNGTKSMINYFNFPVFEDKWLFTFDNRAQGENYNYPSKKYNKYVNDAIKIIEYFIEQNSNITKWYLFGESWGGAIISLLHKKKINPKIKGLFFWNMPCKIVNTNPRKGIKSFINNVKVITTFLFSIPLKTDNPINPKLTNNKMLLRVIKMYEKHLINVGPIIASWKSFKPAWKYLLKNHNNINFRYVQSMEDVMKDEKMFNKLKNYSNKVVLFNKGFHILSFDKNQDIPLFDELDKFINNK